MQPMTRGAYTATLADGEADLTEAQALRHLAFRPGAGVGRDHDDFDALCRHLLVRDAGGAMVACCRVMDFGAEGDLGTSYTAQFYDLSRLSQFAGNRLELGRFCLHPARHDPDILRLAWGALTTLVDAEAVTLLFGCTSFPGVDAGRHREALGLLRNHLAPDAFAPGPRAAERIALPLVPGPDPAAALGLPPLLRTYLTMGGWVSDHAVIDRDLETLHVCTMLPVASVPRARARSLRSVAKGS